MPKAKVIPFVKPEVRAERRIRTLARDSGMVALTTHAKRQMNARRVTLLQVLDCLRHGALDEALHRDVDGFWLGRFYRRVAGDDVRVVAKLIEKDDETVLVITVIG